MEKINKIISKKEYYILKLLPNQKRICLKCNNEFSERVIKFHVNIFNEPSIKVFCSKECKLNWIFKKFLDLG